jgi:Flp pilus assembly protein TadG
MKRPINFNIILKSSKGSSIVFFAITITLIAAVTALTVDIGAFVLEKAKLSSSVDAAALAGAQEWVTKQRQY